MPLRPDLKGVAAPPVDYFWRPSRVMSLISSMEELPSYLGVSLGSIPSKRPMSFRKVLVTPKPGKHCVFIGTRSLLELTMSGTQSVGILGSRFDSCPDIRVSGI